MKTNRKSRLIAAIDVGSHALSMKIAEINKDMKVKTLESLRRTISLGRDTFAMGRVDFETVNETCETLKFFKQLMLDYNIKVYRAVATSAVREADNRDYIVDQIKFKTGLDLDVIGNSEERYFTYKAIKDHMKNYNDIRKEGGIIVDIGSGSIQVSTYNSNKLELSQNIRLGSLRIREMLSSLEGRTLNYPKVLEEHIAGNIDSLKFILSQEDFKNLIVLGGEVILISKLCNRASEQKQTNFILKEDFETVYKELLYKSVQNIRTELDVPQESAEILLPAMMILKKFLDVTTDDRVYTPMITLADGVLSDISGKILNPNAKVEFEDDILSSVWFIARKYRFHEAHARDVEKKSLLLFDSLRKLHGLGKRERFLLQLAAIMHDTGKFINLNEHYIHSYEIIMASDILGISKKELEIVANISRYHSRIVPMQSHANFACLDEASRVIIGKLVAILRIADALDISHKQKIKDIKVTLENNEVIIRVDASEDILLEEWTFETKAEFFQEVFGVVSSIKTKRVK